MHDYLNNVYEVEDFFGGLGATNLMIGVEEIDGKDWRALNVREARQVLNNKDHWKISWLILPVR